MGAPLDDIRSIFGKALELRSPAERVAYVAEACGQDPQLRAEVEALLQAHGAAGSFLQERGPFPATTAAESPLAEGPGTAIGPYKLLEEIGAGGMGLVFVAEQQEPVRRKV